MNIPESWFLESLGGRVDIQHGFAFRSEFFTKNTDSPVLMTPGNFFEEGGFRDQGEKTKYYSGAFPKIYLLKKGDLLVAMTEQASGLLGSAALIPEDDSYLHNQRLGLVAIKSAATTHNNFVFHLLNSEYVREVISKTAAGTKVRHTSPDKIKDVLCLFPPINEQKKIAEILSTWDTQLRQVEQLIAAKTRFKAALMQQLLTGKRRFREFESSREIHSTKHGSHPADWPNLPISEFADEISERAGEDSIWPVLSCTKHKGLIESSRYFGRRVHSENTSLYKTVLRDQFAYATNHIEEGSIGLLQDLDGGIVSPMYTVFATDSRVHPPFLFALFKTELYRHIFESNTSASVDRRGSLRWRHFSQIRVALPSLKEQEKIAALLSTFDQEIRLLQAQLRALKEQKRGLMQQLLSGEVRVEVSS